MDHALHIKNGETAMDHSMHGPHSGMPGMDHGAMCNMNMLFTWDTTDLCIIFRSWHIYSTGSLIFSLFGVALLTAGYEAVRELSRRYDTASARHIELDGSEDYDESGSLLRPGRSGGSAAIYTGRKSRIVKAALYAVQVFYSFFIMLLFMTYNGWVMLAVAVGAFFGYMFFSSANSTSSKTVACH